MSKFLLRRVIFGVLTLFLVSVIVFAATQALPGDPAQAILGKSATPERLAALRRELHLGQSVFAQFGHWLGGILAGNLGTSAATQQPVSQLLSGRIANSAFLVALAAVVAIPLSIALGAWMAMRRDRLVDHVGSTISLILAALPEFVIGIALVLLFATSVFHVFPAVSLIPPGDHAWQHLNAVILPAATLVLAVTPYISRIMRGSMVEVLESE
ncbi:MAG: peptide/nickel transport system permease protein, partial [Solirubrobacteraceae bacterium]|nr:peptide/nickel transport system permease protein [Solirubrobacteraceae bacterium]